MILALWMEEFEEKEPKPYRKVGAVLVLPNEVVYAMDCTRDGVHAAQRLLIKHHNKAQDSKVFLSRKPCSTCAKLLVQAKVKRVLYLPFEPEYYRTPTTKKASEYNKTQMKEVDNLFTASAIGQTKFVLQVEEASLEHLIKKVSENKKRTVRKKEDKVKREKSLLVKRKCPTRWMNCNTVKEELPWPAYA